MAQRYIMNLSAWLCIYRRKNYLFSKLYDKDQNMYYRIHVYGLALRFYKLMKYSLLRTFLCLTTNQFAQNIHEKGEHYK